MVSCMFADSAVGNWKLSGLTVDYFDIVRPHPDYPDGVPFILNDAYGFGVSVPVAVLPAGLMFNHTPRGPWGDAALQAAGINLNVNLYPDGTGVIGEGSYYPDVDLIPGTCITTGQIFPITDSFNWDAPGNELTFPAVNMIGLPSNNAMAGQPAYGLGVNGSSVFDNWTSTPSQIPTPATLPGIFMYDGTVLSYPAAYGGVTAGEWGGYYRSGDVGQSNMCAGGWYEGCNPDVNFLLEWNAIDGTESESGLGDDLALDEDGDGSIYDRTFGVPYISATFVNNTNPLCDISGGALTGTNPSGLAYPVAGDIVDALGGEAAVGALVTGSCMQSVANGAYDNCIGQVYDGVYGQCEEAGGPVGAVTGLCYEASQSEDFAGACAYYGAAGALVATCLQLGFSDEVCADAGSLGVGGVEQYCDGLDGEYNGTSCADMGVNQCDVLTDATFAFNLCSLLAADLTTSETCTEWVDSFYDYDENDNIIGESFFDANAASVLGVTCTEFAGGLQAGLAAGDATTLATIDGLFASATAGLAGPDGMTCSEYGASYVGMCVESVAGANDMYLMDPSLETWGLFLTYNAASVQLYQANGYDIETIMAYYPEYFVNDSDRDFDPSCYYTGETCGGRLLMNFAPTCVPEVEAHQIVAEFVDLAALECEGTGDVAGGWDELPCAPWPPDSPYYCECDLDGYGDCAAAGGGDQCVLDYLCYDGVQNPDYEGPAGDGVVNVVDVVKLIGHILGTSPLGGYLLCEADISGDGVINVVDVVAMVNIALNGSGLGSNDATEATIIDDGSSVSIETTNNGYIGAVDMIVEFNGEFEITLNDQFMGSVINEGNTAHILLIGVENKDILNRESVVGTIFNYTGEIVSISEEMANSREMINNVTYSQAVPSAYEISDAYPNPFNPSTSFEMRLYEASNVTVKIYNLTGQLVDVIAEGSFAADTHTFTWNAENLASGVYFISTQIGSNVENQKVMLIK